MIVPTRGRRYAQATLLISTNWLLACLRDSLELAQSVLVMLRHLHPEVDLAYDLIEQFTQMLHMRTGEQLDAWLEKVRVSQIRELQSFVLGVERDKPAIV